MISIIIPTYNHGAYIRESIDSALSQDYPDKEVIVVNDGSTDDTAEILTSYSGIKVISIPNAGLSTARNIGIDAAHGDWITFLDADDRLLPGALTHLIAPAISMDADICIGGQKTAVLLSPEKALRKTLYRTLDGSAWGKLYRRTILMEERFTPGLYYEDLDLLARLYKRARRVVTCDHEVYFYRINPEGISHSFSERRFDLLEVTEHIERGLEDAPSSLSKSARNRRLAACMHILHLLKSEKKTDIYPEIVEKCKSDIKRLRGEAIINPESRHKVRFGALLTYLGIYL